MKKTITALVLIITVLSNLFVYAADTVVSSIKISVNENVMEIGETQKIITTIYPMESEAQLEYTSSSPNVVMAAVGTIIAKSEGIATVTVRVKGTEIQDSLEITVVKQNADDISESAKDTSVKVSKITVKSKTLYLEKYDTERLSYTVSPSNATNDKMIFKSSNTSVATVDEKGYIYAKKPGNTTITISAEDGNATATVKVYVTELENDEDYDSGLRNMYITYDDETAKDKYEVMATETIQFSVKASPTSASKKVTWRSSNKKIATVDSNGKVTGVKKGTCTIYATSAVNSSKRDSVSIVVTDYMKYPDSIKVIPSENAIFETGNSVQFTVDISPDYTTERHIIWEVLGGATITQSGLLKINDGGEIIVKAYSADRKTVGEYLINAVYNENHFEEIGSTYNLVNSRAIELYFDSHVNSASAVNAIFAAKRKCDVINF